MIVRFTDEVIIDQIFNRINFVVFRKIVKFMTLERECPMVFYEVIIKRIFILFHEIVSVSENLQH